MNSQPTVGFVGLGSMGSPMAANVAAAGFPLIVYNRSPEKAQAVAAQTGAAVAGNVAELANRADIVVTMVADGEVLRTLFLDDEAVLQSLAGKVLLDMSTTGPAFATEFAATLTERGIRFVESPVSGSTAAARAATLMLMVGAGADDLATVRPVLEAIGGPIHHLGAPGAGALAKLAINNLIFGINQCMSESLVLAEQGGLDREAIYDAFLDSAAAAPVMKYRREVFLHPGEGEVAFTLRLAEKDLRLTVELAGRLGVPMDQAALNRREVQQAIDAGFGEDDLAAVAEYLRRRAEQTTTVSKER